MTKDEALQLALKAMKEIIHWYAVRDRNDVFLNFVDQNPEIQKIMKSISVIKEALETKDEPVSMRMPKVGDRVICIEDESLGVVHYLTGGGSPEIKFDDGSHGTFLLRDFAELFGYADTTPQLQTKDEPKCVAIVEVFEKDWRIDYMSLPVGKHKLYAQHYTYTTPQSETKDAPVAYINVEERKLEWANKFINWKTPTVFNLPKIPLYTTPQSETKDEPVYWEMPDGKIVDKWALQFYRGDTGTPLYTTPQPKQEQGDPVAWIEHHKGGDNLVWDEPNKGTPLYTTPQRTWVGLTDEDMGFLFPHGKSVWVQEIVKIIENKLKERNT